MIKNIKRLNLRSETVRLLSESELIKAAGGIWTNLTCQEGCATIYCQTNNVSCPVNCTLVSH